jgi:DNA-binding beta-propeller fold protein YncE
MTPMGSAREMQITRRTIRTALGAAALALLVVCALPAGALGAPQSPPKQPSSTPAPKKTRGSLTQLAGKAGCLVDRSKAAGTCGTARALEGPGPFMGSRAIAVSPDGRNVYVASSESNAVAIFKRSKKTGKLTQLSGKAGCIAAEGAGGCATAVGLDGPNSVAVSADGRNVYATSRNSSSITAFRRSPKTGMLAQLPGAEGCLTQLPQPTPICGSGRALLGPDVVVVSGDGKNVYAGSFFGNAVAVFARNPATGGLAQPTGAAGCIAEAASGGCATAVALGAVEGLAISADGGAVYAGAALSNALTVLTRDPATGALTQATGGSGCIVNATLAGCATGVQLSGADAVAVSPKGGDVYVTSLFANSVTSFTSTSSASTLAQLPGVTACTVWLRAVGCSFGHALSAPEGLAVSPDGTSLYAASFLSGALAVFDRFPKAGPEEGEQPEPAGRVTQKPKRAGCLAAQSVSGCSPGRALGGVSSVAVSPDGRFVYSTAFGSNAVDVFRRTQ